MSEAPVVVVGAGPAGCAAAVQTKRLGVSPLLVDAAGRAGGLVENAFSVENYPGPEAPIPGPELARRLRAHLERFGVPVTPGTVRGITRTADGWRLDMDGGSVAAKAVILAPGTAPVTLPAELSGGMDGELVFYEVRDLLERFPAPERVAVIGGGEASFDYALTLAALGVQVEILVRGAEHRVTGRLVELTERAPAIRVTASSTVREVRRVDGGLEISVLRGGDEGVMRADALLAAIGRTSRLEGLLPAKERDDLTRSLGLFICGDARYGRLGQVGIAVGDGLAAAAAAVALTREGHE